MRRTTFLIGLPFLAHAGLALLFVLAVSPAAAEVHTITATGEYRMTGKDTPEEAKRRALQEARRLVLDRTWAYFLGVTELKPFRLTLNNIQEFTKGLIEVTEDATRSQREGETVVVRSDVTAKVDPVMVQRRLNAVRQSQNVGD